MRSEKGVLYVATGRSFIQEAERSVNVLNKKMPNLDTTIVTEKIDIPEGFDRVIGIEDPSYGFEDKIRGISKTPYKKTLFLDTDTYVLEDLGGMFEILKKFDVGVTQNQNRDLHTQNIGVPEAFPEYSTGVIVFDKSKTKDMISKWKEFYEKGQNGDQPSFRKALYESGVRVATLPREYNYSVRTPAHLIKPVKVLHGRLIELESDGAGKYYNLENAKKRLSNEEKHKLVSRGGFERGVNPPVKDRIKMSIKKRGILETVTRIAKRAIYGKIKY